MTRPPPQPPTHLCPVWLPSRSRKRLLSAPPDDAVNLEIAKTGIGEIRAGGVGQTIGMAAGVDVSEETSCEVGVTQISVAKITTGKTRAPQRRPSEVSAPEVAHLEEAPIEGRVAKVGTDKRAAGEPQLLCPYRREIFAIEDVPVYGCKVRLRRHTRAR
ncbi:hypothetical protein GCM10023195_22670 [Actinoallomurus liliacearum]|uniref:Uncharacterized protein n=1 Tax=Actinoallomurus liliacearum TaxID=1080073 RepID=A0ABP8TGL7_9ACTN